MRWSVWFNKGFKNCEKQLCENKSHFDIGDAVNNAFQDAKKRGYRNILVLEDDFFFSTKITDRDVQRISKFVTTKPFECYTLGCMPTFTIPTASPFHLRVGQFAGAHAMIFSPDMREHYMKAYSNDPCSIGHVDMYYWKMYTCHAYVKPIAYQLFPHTENMDNWPWYGRLLVKCMPTISQRAEPWYSICYTISLFPAVLTIVLALYLTIRLMKTATSANLSWSWCLFLPLFSWRESDHMHQLRERRSVSSKLMLQRWRIGKLP